MVSSSNLRRPSNEIFLSKLGDSAVFRLTEWALYASAPQLEEEWKKRIIFLISQT